MSLDEIDRRESQTKRPGASLPWTGNPGSRASSASAHRQFRRGPCSGCVAKWCSDL